MSRIFKSIVAGFLILSIATWGTPAWAVIETEVVTINVGVAIGKAGTYSLSAAVVGALQFDQSTVSTTDPWRVSSGYIDIDLAAAGTNTNWGLRIVSDNVADLLDGIDRNAGGVLNEGGAPLTPAADGSYTNSGGDVFAGHDLDRDAGPPFSYAGLINTSAMENPSMRAALAWQVGGYDTSGAATAASVPANPGVDGARGASSVVGDFDDPWAYISDRSNTDYRSGPVTTPDVTDINTPTGGRVVYRDDTNDDANVDASDRFVTNYTLVAYGTPYGANLATHPGQYDDDADVENRPLPRLQDTSSDPWNIYVYLCAQFMNTDWTIAGGTDFVLPAGSYTTSIYLELFSE